MKKTLLKLVFVIIFLVLWQIIESWINLGRIGRGETTLELFLPTPQKIIISFIQNIELILNEMSYTLSRALLGLFIGTFTAVLMVIIFLIIPVLRELIMPLSLAVNSFPIVGFAPLVILAFGQGSWIGIVFISALISYFPTLITLDHSVRCVDKELIELMQLWGANRWQIFSKVQLPSSLPSLFAAARLSIPASIIGATLGEWLGTKHGIGHLITLSFYQLRPGLMYASLISLTVLSLILVFIISFLEKKLFTWKN